MKLLVTSVIVSLIHTRASLSSDLVPQVETSATMGSIDVYLASFILFLLLGS